jgi:hypothetical protein
MMGKPMKEFTDLKNNLIAVAHDVFAPHGMRSVSDVDGNSAASVDAPLTAPHNGDLFVSSIGFASALVRGNIVLVGDRAAVTKLKPAELEADDESTLSDVFGEFVNMLAGSFKNRLLPRGVVFLLGTPTNAVAKRLRIQPMTALGTSTLYSFRLGDARLDVRLDAVIEPGFQLGPEPPSHANDMVGGDMMMF